MKKKTIIKFHIAFWLAASSITIFDTLFYIEKAPNVPLFLGAFIRIVFNVITFYIFYSVISNKIFDKKGIFLFICSALIYIIVSSFVVSYLYFLPFMFHYSVPNPIQYITNNLLKNRFYNVISGHTLFSILGALSKMSLIWYENKMKQKDIEKQNITTELAMLRAQINPHFLFNTLNNIKSLIQRLPSKAINSVEKLSDLMHYMLYESSVEKVPIKNEIQHIQNYLDLEKIRYSDPDYIDFQFTGDSRDIYIPPLIFMPFIENAFKHGNKLSPAPGVKIELRITKEKIFFEIQNRIKENIDESKRNSGFGLVNIKRRLDLLFDKDYNLEIEKENKIFFVKLTINLK